MAKAFTGLTFIRIFTLKLRTFKLTTSGHRDSEWVLVWKIHFRVNSLWSKQLSIWDDFIQEKANEEVILSSILFVLFLLCFSNTQIYIKSPASRENFRERTSYRNELEIISVTHTEPKHKKSHTPQNQHNIYSNWIGRERKMGIKFV